MPVAAYGVGVLVPELLRRMGIVMMLCVISAMIPVIGYRIPDRRATDAADTGANRAADRGPGYSPPDAAHDGSRRIGDGDVRREQK